MKKGASAPFFVDYFTGFSSGPLRRPALQSMNSISDIHGQINSRDALTLLNINDRNRRR